MPHFNPPKKKFDLADWHLAEGFIKKPEVDRLQRAWDKLGQSEERMIKFLEEEKKSNAKSF